MEESNTKIITLQTQKQR